MALPTIEEKIKDLEKRIDQIDIQISDLQSDRKAFVKERYRLEQMAWRIRMGIKL